MRLLLDTQILLWSAGIPGRLSKGLRGLIEDPDSQLVFSAASVWEIAIKNSLGREDFRVDPHLVRRGLLENGYDELPVTGLHSAGIEVLPPIHKDPFDRILVMQALMESLTLVTADPVVARYPGSIRAF